MTQRSGRGRLGSWVALLAALSGAALMIDASPREAQAQGRADVAIVDVAYQPGSIKVQAGILSPGRTPGPHHTVTADDGSVDSGPLAPGASFSQVFPAAGLFTYHCTIHPQMTGAVTITQAPDLGEASRSTRSPGPGQERRSALSRCRWRWRWRSRRRPWPPAPSWGVSGRGSVRVAWPSVSLQLAVQSEGDGRVVLLALAPLLLLVPSVVAGPATPTATASGIPPVIWEIVSFSEPESAPVTITDPSRSTVQFLPAGRLLARLDCNQGSGGYTAAAGVLALTPLAVTTALCPPDSEDTRIQTILERATSYLRPDGALLLHGDKGAFTCGRH